MRPRIALGIAAVLILVLCEGMAHEAAAKLVRNAHPAPSNPAVEAGGLRVRRGSPPPVPYSLIGALASQNQVYWLYPRSAWLVPQRGWFSQSAFWPRRFFSPLSFGRRCCSRFRSAIPDRRLSCRSAIFGRSKGCRRRL